MNTPVRFKTCLATLFMRTLPLAGLPVLALMAGSAGAQTTYYWDGNGATTGSGSTTLAGNWGGASAAAFWGTSATGTSVTTAASLTSADTAVFSANDGSGTGSNYNSTYTVTLGAAQSVAGLVISGASVGSGNTGGTVTLAGSGSPGLGIGSGGVTLNGSNGDPTFAASLGTITLTADQTWTVNNAHVWTVAAAVAGNATAGNTRTWTFGYVNPYTNAYSGVISNGSGGGELAITLNNTNGSTTGSGINNISGTANTYTGKTTIMRGILQISSLKNVNGGSSSLGAVTTVANGTIDIGSGANSGSLYYNGSAASTSDRVINLAGGTGGATISSINGTAANTLTLTSAFTAATGNKTLTLQGANTGANTISGAIGDPDGSTKISLVKSEAGRWVLGGANTYSGGTTINAGTLSVGAAGTLGQNVAGNNITIAGGNLLLSADTNVGSSQAITITSSGGGIGVAYTPTSFPAITDNSGATGGVFGINYTGTGGIGSVAGIDGLFTSSSRWFLGSFVGGSGTYTGSSLTAGNGSTYRLGGGGGVLTMQNNVLTGANNLLVGSTGGGTVIMSDANTYTGKTTLQNGTLTVSSVNKVSGGTASSSLGAPTTAGNGTIDIGSGSNAVTFNYAGTGETTDRILNFTGTTGAVAFTNSGTGNINFTGTSTFTGSGVKAFTLGTGSDTYGGTLGPILDNGGAGTTVIKNGLTNSTWVLNGTNTYTGTTTINGGVLSASDLLASSARITLAGSSSTQLGVLQGQGTITRQLGTGASRVDWATNSGFAAKGGKLTLTLTSNGGVAGGTLTWGSGSFMGTGTTPMVFGSSTADNQVELTNNFTFGDNVSSGFNRTIYVEKGAGGDSALLSGVISVGGGTSALNGFVKTGAGTLILSGANTYTGTTTVGAGTLIAQNNVPSGSAGALGNASSTITLGAGNINGSDGTLATNASPALLIGGAFSVDRPVTIANIATAGTYAIGGSTDNNATFSGLITPSQSLAITQVATTGGHVLTVSGNITGGATAAVKTITFDNVGGVLQTTGVISNGAGGGSIAVTKTNTGTATLAGTNTYTGATTLTGGVLSVGTLTNGGVSGPIGAATNAAANLVFNGGTLQYTGATVSTDRNFTLNAGTTGTIDVSTGATNLTLSGASTATTGGLTKTGAGTLTLGGANLYTGTTTISAGTLALGASGSIAGSATINLGTSGSQGILDLTAKSAFAFGTGQTLKGYGTVNIGAGKAVTINGSFSPGNSPGITTITGDLVLANAVAVPTTGAVTTMELGGNGGVAGTDYDKVIVSGQLTFGGTLNIVSYLSYNLNQAGTYHLFGFGGETGNFDFVSVAGTALVNNTTSWSGANLGGNGYDYVFTLATGDLVVSQVSSVPEPSTLAALAGWLALAGASFGRRRRTGAAVTV